MDFYTALQQMMYQPDPRTMQLEQAKKLFAQMYRTNPSAAFAIAAHPGGKIATALDDWISKQYFNGDPNAYKGWINQQQYGDGKFYNYNPTTGQINNNQNGQVMNPGFTSNYTNYMQQMKGGTGQGGYTGAGAPGTEAPGGVPNQFLGMQQLFRDNQGMLHDPGDNPITTPTTGTTTPPPPGWNPFPWMQGNNLGGGRGGMGHNGSGGVTRPGTPSPTGPQMSAPSAPYPGLGRSAGVPGTTTPPPTTTTTPGAPPNTPVVTTPKPWDYRNSFNNYSQQ